MLKDIFHNEMKKVKIESVEKVIYQQVYFKKDDQKENDDNDFINEL